MGASSWQLKSSRSGPSAAGKGVPSDERTDVERSTDLAAHEPSEEALDGWEFGIAEERSD